MRETAKRLVVLSGVAAAMLASAVPAMAQEGASQYGSEPVAQEVTATFELAVEGEAPEGASFFGYLDNGEPFPVALSDPDGDGVYVGSYGHVGMGDSLGAAIVQGTGSHKDVAVGTSPGEPASAIWDFGLVTFDGDETLSASVSFAEEGDEPAAPERPTTSVEEEIPPASVFVGVEAEKAAEEADKEANEVMTSSGTRSEERALPSTGGAALGAIGAGALLTAVGLLARRVAR